MARKGKTMENQNKLVDQFHKNSMELIEIQLTKWKAQNYVDILILALPNQAEPGTQQPTKNEICLNIEKLPRLIEALQKVQKAIEK